MGNGQLNSSSYKLDTIYLFFTKYCNLNCRHCWVDPVFTKNEGKETGEVNNDINVEYIFKALKEAKKLGLRTVKLTGGEPFLRKETIEVLEWLKDKGLNVILETNATLIGEQEARAIGGNRNTYVAVSLDGPDTVTHERLRGARGSFERAIMGIRRIGKYTPGARMQVSCSLWKGNKAKMRDMIDYCIKLGVSNLKINPVMNISRADTMRNNGDLLSIKDVLDTKTIMQNYIAKKHLGRRLRMVYGIPPAFITIGELRINNGSNCRIKSILGIMSDGTVSICGIGKLIRELGMGNIKRDSIKDIWENNQILRVIRADIPAKLEGVCAKCILRVSCLGKCRADAYWTSKSLMAPFTFCQKAFEQGCFPKTRLLSD